jgi:lon-related putative ATP-dependent protease
MNTPPVIPANESSLVMPRAETFELQPSALRLRCDPDTVGFATTAELPSLTDVIGQPRAIRALELGSAISGMGYNIFAVGLPNSGRTALVRQHLLNKAAQEPTPDDWCYVHSFQNPHQPTAIRLPAGHARDFRADMQTLIERCERDIPAAFESEEYTQERSRLVGSLKKQQEAEFGKLAELASNENFALAKTPFGVMLVPTRDGNPLTPEQVETLSPQEVEHISQTEQQLAQKVNEGLETIRDLEAAVHQRVQDLNARTALYVIEPAITVLKTKYATVEPVVTYLQSVRDDLASNVKQFIHKSGESSASQRSEPDDNGDWRRRYKVNIIIDNAGMQGAPVIVETQPSYNNLLGRIEHKMLLGAMQTDFTLIRPGAIHRANGGYLILNAQDLLTAPYAWDGLKRVLRDAAIRIVELGSQLSLISTTSLEPEPIPLEVKIVLIGTPHIYYLLLTYDDDFAKLFKVKAEFATTMQRTPQAEREYGLYAKTIAEANGLPPFDAGAVARLIEHGARLADDQQKLSTRFGMIGDVIREAAYWAGKDGSTIVTADAVSKAIREADYRENLIQTRLQELIEDETLRIDAIGRMVGQLNALSVISLGDYAFGQPTRITASARPGQAGIIDIERRAELGGPIHTKAVLILSGFLGQRYGRKQPLNLSASLAFEQSYEGVEGDSASAAEVVTLLSAIADIPLRQDRAITGSMDQHGKIQAIGGVNEKIEGFFDICQMKGLTGTQGVIIPASNVRHLMLRQDVIDAVAAGSFHVWKVTTIEEVIALLTDMPAGVLQPDGSYPPGTFNDAVMRALSAFTLVVQPALRGGNHPEPDETASDDRVRL